MKLITSESVNIGHPDKTCDIIADAFLDEALKQDPYSQMAVECAIKNNKLFVYGEATTKAKLNYSKIAKEVLKEIGYKNKFKIIKEISIQSPDINHAVCKDKIMANDQGIIFGYATDETKNFMPLPICVAHRLMKVYDEYRRIDLCFMPDAKGQVTVEYDDGDQPKRIDTVVVSVSHTKNISNEEIKERIFNNVVKKVLDEFGIDYSNCKYIINPSGMFTIWGSFSDSGCVGRKIVVDTYGGVGKIGGGCFSSKNASKVDRSGAYYARYVAKNIVANGLAKKCEIEISYAIGMDKELSLNINTFGTEKVELKKIYEIVRKNFDFSPQNIIDELNLLKPVFKQTAYNGHFGNENFAWEKVKKLK